jgi:hypothetical protein
MATPVESSRESGTLSSITLNPGYEIMLRWYDFDDVGNDHGSGIDD